MNTLTIDIGNSGTKTELWSDEGFISRQWHADLSIAKILEEVEQYRIQGIIVSTVKKDSSEFIEALKSGSECGVVDFNIDEIRRYYNISRYTGNLGPDRMAAVLGSRITFDGTVKLIVDLGTAMTLDIADENGNFIAGNISLGLYSRMKALSTSTDLLPEVGVLKNDTGFGEDTVSAIEYGALNGVAGEILYSFEEAKKKYNAQICVITGGDGKQLYNILTDKIKIYWDKHLVGRGLDYHIRTHYLHCEPERL